MAKRGINDVVIVGDMGSDPEVRYTPNGDTITTLSVATSESWLDKNTGQKQEKTEWHRVSVFGKLAESIAKYLCKGSRVYVKGSLNYHSWEKAGVKQYGVDIRVRDFGHTVQWLGGKKTEQPQAQAQSATPAGMDDNFDDDIPF